MDELELRIAALETVVIEAFAWIDPAAVDDAIRSIEAGLDTAGDADEVAIRQGAAQLLRDARDRYRGPGALLNR